ncbi:MAG TPA: NAD-dependent epimerase/dehydratase family protein, partial [Tepidisphaeraceae bacterium]|nr:NAD-dependent epimerase/dehydratase family protein [Tepidisphaeraceae bacterium]
MKIFITGSSGFVGRAVVDEAVAQGHDVVALVHQKPVPDRGGRVASLTGGLFDESLIGAMAACSAVIHLIGIIAEKADTTFEKIHVEGTRRIVEAAKTASIRRYIQMSALGTRAGAVSNY